MSDIERRLAAIGRQREAKIRRSDHPMLSNEEEYDRFDNYEREEEMAEKTADERTPKESWALVGKHVATDDYHVVGEEEGGVKSGFFMIDAETYMWAAMRIMDLEAEVKRLKAGTDHHFVRKPRGRE